MPTADTNRFEIENDEIEVVENVILLGSKIEREAGCAGEIQRGFAFGR